MPDTKPYWQPLIGADVRCPYENNRINECFIEEDLRAVGGACPENKYGSVCGPIAGYVTLVNNFNRLTELDEHLPIVATFDINKMPAGVPPPDIRQQWIGVTAPLRENFDAYPEQIQVNPVDAILSLLMHKRMTAAQWFFGVGMRIEPFGASWGFRGYEGAVTSVAPGSSLEYYNQYVPESARTAIESALAK